MHLDAVLRRLLIILSLLLATLSASELRVASLHPLLGDLARQVGGGRVEVIDLLGKHSDPHHFEPTPDQLQAAGTVDLFLASGMGLESYLPSLQSILPDGSELIILGDKLPSIEGHCNDPDHQHHNHQMDPHWWHSIDTFRRAVGLTATAFANADPEGAEHYLKRSLAYRTKLDQLERWTRREIARIPRAQRILATAHDAFGYFCRDYEFKAIPVGGINREQMPDPRTLAELIAKLRAERAPVIFPEAASNPKVLAALTEDTGIRLAPPLDADGSTSDSYESMFRGNVSTIVEALGK